MLNVFPKKQKIIDHEDRFFVFFNLFSHDSYSAREHERTYSRINVIVKTCAQDASEQDNGTSLRVEIE